MIELNASSDKLTDSMTFKCTPELKRIVIGCADAENIDPSAFVRNAVIEAVERKRSMYVALTPIFSKCSQGAGDT